MDLKSINESCLLESAEDQKPAIKLQELKPDKKYAVISSRVIQSKFGACVLVELDENVVFLPKRVTKSLESQVEYLVDKKYSIIFRGLKDVGQPNPMSLFEFIES